MATSTETQVLHLFIGILGRGVDGNPDVDPAIYQGWVSDIEGGTKTLDDLLTNLTEQSPEGIALFNLTTEESISQMYRNLFDREPDADGLAYWVDEVDSGDLDEVEVALALAAGAQGSDVNALQAQFDEQFAIATVDLGVDGQEYSLTSSTDTMTGTADNDSFMAKLAQNSFTGGVSNTLSSADSIDGGAGSDSLTAVITGEFVGVDGTNEIDIQPETTSVEYVTFEARDTGAGSEGSVNVDAKNMTDVVEIGSLFSDGDLVIENLTTLTESGQIRNTRDMTITMDHTEGQNSSGDGSDLTVYFDEDYLNSSTSFGGSGLEVRVVNAITNVLGENPLFGTASFSFTVDGVSYTVDVEDIGNDDTLSGIDAYTAVVNRINEVMSDEGLPTVSAELGGLRNAVFSIDITTDDDDYEAGDPAGTFYPIFITNSGAEILGQGQFTQADVADDTNIAATQLESDGSTDVLPIAINVELDKVGRDGEGGNLIIGGKDQNGDNDEEEDQNDGFQQFDVTVNGNEDQPSNLRFITSTNQMLETVNIANGDEYEGASLEIRDAFNGVGTNLTNATNVETVNANAFSGDLTLGNDGGAATDRMQNVDVFTATGGGDVEVWADISGAEKSQFSMSTGTGSDTFNVTLDGDAVDTIGTSYAAVTGGGNDTVIVSMIEGGVSHNTTESLDNLSIDTSSGNDSVTLIGGTTNGAVANAGNIDGDANFNISAGGGTDTVYINSIDETPAEVQTITIVADGVDDGDETLTVNYDSNGDGVLNANVAVNLAAIDPTDAAATATAVSSALNADATFSAAATASANAGVVTIVYEGTANHAEVTTVAGGTVNTLAGTPATVATGGTSSATKGEWSIGTATEPQTWNDRVLYEATLTVTYAGFEQQVTIDTDRDGNFTATQATINEAVIDAISSNSELSRLLETTLGTGDARLLTINALQEGANDLTISVNQPTIAAGDIDAGDVTALQTGLVQTGVTADSSLADTAAEIAGLLAGIDGNINETGTAAAAPDLVLDTGDGTDGTNETSITNYSVIDLGTGDNDLVVLNSDVDSVNTVDFTAQWGKVSVVNWFEEQANAGNDILTDAVTGNHILDFTVWLDDQTSVSGSELSAVRTATTTVTFNAGQADLDLGTNEVVVFNGYAQNGATDETWADMDAADVDASLEATNQYGANAFGNTANVIPANAYPTTNLLDSILMVENDLNAGEYKVFNVETDSTQAAGSQHTVTLLGVVDFGETIDAANGFAAANLA